MSTDNTVTNHEQEIVKTVRRWMGSNLSSFLLSGYGEPNGAHRRIFSFSGNRAEGDVRYQFEMVNGSELALPSGKDPAVLAALLHLAITQKKILQVAYDDALMLRELGWQNLPESRLIIAHAVERYFSTAFYMVNTYLPKSRLLYGRYSHYSQLITSYENIFERSGDRSPVETSFTLVKFTPGFLQDLAAGRRYFFGIDFEALKAF